MGVEVLDPTISDSFSDTGVFAEPAVLVGSGLARPVELSAADYAEDVRASV